MEDYNFPSIFPVLVSRNSPHVYPINYWDDAMMSIPLLEEYHEIDRESFTISFDHEFFLKEIINNLSPKKIFGQLKLGSKPVRYLHTYFQIIDEPYKQLNDKNFDVDDKRFLLPELNKIISDYTEQKIYIIILLSGSNDAYEEDDIVNITNLFSTTEPYLLHFRSVGSFPRDGLLEDEGILQKYENRLMFLKEE